MTKAHVLTRETDLFLLRESVHRTIDALVVARAPVGDAMNALLVVGQTVAPCKLWPKLSRLNWKGSASGLAAKVRRACAKTPPPRATQAYWFGMPELDWNAGIIQLIAMGGYSPAHPGHEYVAKALPWLGEVDFSVPVLDQAAEIVRPMALRDAEAASLLLFTCAMGMTCFLAAVVAADVGSTLLARGRVGRGIVAGPSGGEYHHLGMVSKNGWKPSPTCWLASLDEDEDEDGE